MRDEESGWWDIAQVCLNGHLVNPQVIADRALNQGFCEHCGRATIAACRRCKMPIRGVFHTPGTYLTEPVSVPAYCRGCGAAYSWTDKRTAAAKELIEELAHLKPQERELLKRTIDELVLDTPRTQLAVVRFKHLVAKVGPDAAIALREMLVYVVSDAVRRAIWGA